MREWSLNFLAKNGISVELHVLVQCKSKGHRTVYVPRVITNMCKVCTNSQSQLQTSWQCITRVHLGNIVIG